MRAWRVTLSVVTASLALLWVGGCSRGEPRTFELNGEQLTEAEFIDRVHVWRLNPRVEPMRHEDADLADETSLAR